MGAVTTTEDPGTARPPSLAQRLSGAAATIEQIPAGTPALVRLAVAWNGFYVARVVSVLLDAEAVPHRDVYELAAGWCTQALDVLYDVAGRQLVRRYSPDHVAGRPLLQELTTAGQVELSLASDLDIDRIAAAMISLAAGLEQLLTNVAEDEAALPGPRAAAGAVTPAAHNIWSQYGGDGGGW
jgi:hypothetical protein